LIVPRACSITGGHRYGNEMTGTQGHFAFLTITLMSLTHARFNQSLFKSIPNHSDYNHVPGPYYFVII